MKNYFKISFLLISIVSFCAINPNPIKTCTQTVHSLSKWGPSSIKRTLVKGNASFSGAITIKDCEIQGDTDINGAATIKRSTLNTLYLKGAGSVDHVTIHGNTTIKGANDFSNTTVYGKTDIYGAVSARASTFKNAFSISGALTAWDSHFTDLLLSATKTKLNHCTTHSITVDNEANSWKIEIFGFCLYEKKQDAYLILNDCIIEGDIIFKGPAGTVTVDAKTVIKGKVVNGSVIRK